MTNIHEEEYMHNNPCGIDICDMDCENCMYGFNRNEVHTKGSKGRTISGLIGTVSFLYLLGVIGGLELNTLSIPQALIRMVISMAIILWSVSRNNKKK